MWTPSSSPVLASATTLTKPSVSLTDSARPSAANGNLPTLSSAWPFAFASSSVSPVDAISGSVKTTAGIVRTSNAALWPAMISATTSPSLVALCASIMPPITSPIA